MDGELIKQPSRLRVTVVSKLKHSELHELADKVGGQSTLASILGVRPTELCAWCNLRRCPPIKPTKAWTQERIDKLELDLLELTGKLMEDLFPSFLRENQEFLSAPKRIESSREVEDYSLRRLASNFSSRSDIQPDRIAVQSETKDAVARSLSILSKRQREIIERRFGLRGERPETLESIGDSMRITKERVRSIESVALRKLSGEVILQEAATP